jgi:hypothetical protein
MFKPEHEESMEIHKNILLYYVGGLFIYIFINNEFKRRFIVPWNITMNSKTYYNPFSF